MEARAGAWGVTLQLEDFALAAEIGFHHLQMPIHQAAPAGDGALLQPRIADLLRPIWPGNPARNRVPRAADWNGVQRLWALVFGQSERA